MELGDKLNITKKKKVQKEDSDDMIIDKEKTKKIKKVVKVK